MGQNSFVCGFVSVFVAVMAFLIYFLFRFSGGNSESGLATVYPMIIVLFLIFGIIVISLYMKRVRKKAL